MIHDNHFIIAEQAKNTNEPVNFWSFDMLKVLLAILVVMRHCAQAFCKTDSPFFIIVVNILSPVAVPTFFAISGFLLFRKPVTFLRLVHQIKRILKLYLVWSLIYLPLTVYSVLKSPESIWKNLVTYFQNFLFSGSHYHLWFLPALAFSLFFVWFLDKCTKRRTQFMIITVLFILGVFVENFTFLLPKPVFAVYSIYLQIFLTTRNGLFFGCLFVWIGKHFSETHRTINTAHLKKHDIIALPVLLGLTAEGLLLTKIHENFTVNMLLTAVPFVFALLPLAILLSSKQHLKYTTKPLREASTFLFCCHPIAITVITILKKVGMHLPNSISIIVILVICILGTLLHGKLASRIRILKHLV